MSFAIARIKKHKSTSLQAVDNHNRRLVSTSNCDPKKTFLNQRYSKDSTKSTKELVQEKLDSLGIDKHRKDAVVAVELVLTASPEYFRPENPKDYNQYDDVRMNKWKKATSDFLKSKYSSQLIVEVNLHLDEATPHMHVILVPALKKKRKKKQSKKEKEAGCEPVFYESNGLCAKEMFNRDKLIELQTDYAESLKHLGLERGKRNSKTKHKEIKQYYKLAESTISRFKALTERVKSFKSKPSPSHENNEEIPTASLRAHQNRNNDSDYDLFP